MSYLFTSESVSEGHPDKIADQISDAILDNFLAFDPNSKVACETLVTTGQVILAGEVKSNTYLDFQEIARNTINEIGYNNSEYRFTGDSCGVINLIHDQSEDISIGVVETSNREQGAGDQGIMFGYACNETKNFMPLSLELSNRILKELSLIRKEKKDINYLRPDAKSQVTIEYSEDHKPLRIDTIVLSTQHDNFDSDEKMLEKIVYDIRNILIPRVIEKCEENVKKLFTSNIKYHINPTGKFVIGGPHGDTGLTGRKIIVDTYGGRGAHGGGAFSGKDPSKVDRSAAYISRYIAKNLIASGISDRILVQLSYAIGVSRPTSVFIDTYTNNIKRDKEISDFVINNIDLRPKSIEERLKLRNPIYKETASYGHFGKENEIKNKIFTSKYFGEKSMNLDLFTWEKLDLINDIKKNL